VWSSWEVTLRLYLLFLHLYHFLTKAHSSAFESLWSQTINLSDPIKKTKNGVLWEGPHPGSDPSYRCLFLFLLFETSYWLYHTADLACIKMSSRRESGLQDDQFGIRQYAPCMRVPWGPYSNLTESALIPLTTMVSGTDAFAVIGYTRSRPISTETVKNYNC
jgi:hypothetical protein